METHKSILLTARRDDTHDVNLHVRLLRVGMSIEVSRENK